MVNDMHPETKSERDPITVTVQRACELSGLGLTTIWKLIGQGHLIVRRAAFAQPRREERRA
jgi:hypothetical protein